jgi:hypothetical protein
VIIFFTGILHLLLGVSLLSRRVIPFFSETLLIAWQMDFSLYVSFGSGRGGVVPVRRGEEADRNRNSGVKVQVDDSSMQLEKHFSNAFRRAERKTRRGLLLLLEKERGKKAFGYASCLK